MSLQQEVDLSKLREARPAPAVARRIVEGAMAQTAPRASRAWLVAVPVAFAAGIAIAVVLLRPGPMVAQPLVSVDPRAIKPDGVNPVVPQVIDPKTLPLPPLPSLTTGQVAEAALGPVPFRAGRHVVKVDAHSKVLATKVEPKSVQLKVATGAAKFEVATLEAEEVFAVSAGALTFEAVGTRFEVEVEGECTRLEVQEGIVRVSREGKELELVGEGKRGTFCEGAPGPESLSEEDRLLSDALDKVRTGSNADLGEASALLRSYCEKYPDGTYQQEALFYLARISQRLGKAEESKAFAAKFLERWPTGRRADELRSPGK